MDLALKKWLASLVPISAAADDLTKGDIDLCRQRARCSESLVIVGVNEDCYVDENHYGAWYYRNKRLGAAGLEYDFSKMSDGQNVATRMAHEFRDLLVEYYSILEQIASLREQQSHELDRQKLRALEVQEEELRVRVQPMKVAVDARVLELAEFHYRFAPEPVQMQKGDQVAETKAKTTRKRKQVKTGRTKAKGKRAK